MSEPDVGVRRRRVFFALWPDAEVRDALVRSTRTAVTAAGGRPVPQENLHITLAVLGEVGGDALAAIRRISPPRIGTFDLSIDKLGYRQRAKLLWAAPGDVPPALLALEAAIWERLAEIGVERERRAYLPHVTLARRAERADVEIEPVRWPVREFVLVESTLGPPHSTYTLLESWSL